MENEILRLYVDWKPIRFSRYLRGKVTDATGIQDRMAVDQIYKRIKSGQIRIYSGMNLDGVFVKVNGRNPKRMESRGRFGRLYIEE